MLVASHPLSANAPGNVPAESHEAIYARIFRQLRPRTALPSIRVEFRRYASANAQVKLDQGTLLVLIADTLAGLRRNRCMLKRSPEILLGQAVPPSRARALE